MNTQALHQHTLRFSDYLREQDKRPSPRFLAGAAVAGVVLLATFTAVIPESVSAKRALPQWDQPVPAALVEPMPGVQNASYWNLNPAPRATPAVLPAPMRTPALTQAVEVNADGTVKKCLAPDGSVSYTNGSTPCMRAASTPSQQAPAAEPPIRAAAFVIHSDGASETTAAASATGPRTLSDSVATLAAGGEVLVSTPSDSLAAQRVQ